MSTGSAHSARQLDADVIVIGAGIIGAAVARELSLDGHSVLIIDPEPGGGSSAGNAGLVVPGYAMPMSTPSNLIAGVRSFASRESAVRLAAPMGVQTLLWLARFAAACRPGRVKRDAATLHAMASESLAIYQELDASGLDLQLQQSGWLWSFETESAFRKAGEQARAMQEAGAECLVVTSAEAKHLEPALASITQGGIWFPREAVLNPGRVAALLLEDAISIGARHLPARVIRRDRATADGPVTVATDRGKVTARSIVVAAGADSRAVGARFGDSVPIEAGTGWSVTLRDDAETLRRPLMAVEQHVVISPFAGCVRVTGGMQFGGGRRRDPTREDIRGLLDTATRLVPALRHLEQIDAWQGARPMTPTGVPIIGRSPRASNVFYATGHGPLGVTLAPLTARMIAGLLREVSTK